MSVAVAQLPGSGHPKSRMLMQVSILGVWLIRVIVHEGVGSQGRRGEPASNKLIAVKPLRNFSDKNEQFAELRRSQRPPML